jgi:Glycosyltransferase sugar-binding region containing DXD motif
MGNHQGEEEEMTTPIHFVSIGEFKYPHMIAVYSAHKAHINQDVEINLWYVGARPKGKFYDAIAPLVSTKEHKQGIFPALVNKDISHAAVVGSMKDFAEWDILYDYGGIFLDLDTFCISELASLLKEYYIFASLDVKDPESIPFPLNNAVMGVRDPNDPVIKRILSHVSGKLEQQVTWGDTGPIAVSTVFMSYLTPWTLGSNFLVPHEVLCPYGGNEVAIYYEESENLHAPVTLPVETRAFHLYAKASGPKFDQVNADWVRRSSSLYARMIKEHIPEAIWSIEAPYDIQNYLNNRGKHYAPLLYACRDQQRSFFRIFEFGTCRGDTAYAMIKLTGERIPECNIEYTGLDLFDATKPDIRDMEAAGNYIAPSVDSVYGNSNGGRCGTYMQQ